MRRLFHHTEQAGAIGSIWHWWAGTKKIANLLGAKFAPKLEAALRTNAGKSMDRNISHLVIALEILNLSYNFTISLKNMQAARFFVERKCATPMFRCMIA